MPLRWSNRWFKCLPDISAANKTGPELYELGKIMGLLAEKTEVIQSLAGGDAAMNVELVRISGKFFVRKKTTPQHAASECYFYEMLARHEVNTLHVHDKNIRDGLFLIDYIDGSPNLFKHATAQNFSRWGASICKVHAIAHPPMRFDQFGNRQELDWSEFVRDEWRAISDKTRDIAECASVLDAVSAFMDRWLQNQTSAKTCLLHGDLHVGNALVRRDDVVVFDNIETISAGNPLYDLALIIINFPETLFGSFDDKENLGHFLPDIISGYGRHWPKSNQHSDLLGYVLLRAFERYPSSHEPHLMALARRISLTL